MQTPFYDGGFNFEWKSFETNGGSDVQETEQQSDWFQITAFYLLSSLYLSFSMSLGIRSDVSEPLRYAFTKIDWWVKLGDF